MEGTERIRIRTTGMTKKARREVGRSIGRLLAEYPDYLLAEATSDQREELRLSGVEFEVEEGPPRINLRSVEFDPLEEQPAVARPAAEVTGARARGIYDVYIVQFEGPAKPEWIDALRDAGGVVTDPVPQHAYLVRLKRDAVDDVAAQPHVRWVGRYEPAYKLSPKLTGHRGPAPAAALPGRALDAATISPEPWGDVTVHVHERRDRRKVAERLERAGGRVLSSEKARIRATIDPASLAEILEMREVKWVEPYSLPKLHNDVATGIMGIRPAIDRRGLDGSGQIVAVADTGLDTGTDDSTMHADLAGRVSAIQSWPVDPAFHPFLDNSSWDDGAADLDSGHGTHVSGSVLGSGARSDGEITGSAPSAELVFQAVEQWADIKSQYEPQSPDGYYLLGIPSDLTQLLQAAYDAGARIHTNSWGNREHGQYTAESEDIDEFVWDHKDMVVLFSAGNDGTDADADGEVDLDSLGSHACAKNVITVGASENDRQTGGYQAAYGQYWPTDFPSDPVKSDRLSDNPDGMVAFSSRGPTDDGLLKPDVVAPGTNILSVRSSKAAGKGWGLLPIGDGRRDHYMYMGGTSMATPLAAGAVALIRQYLSNRRPSYSPSAAAIKGVLIHGAASLAGQYLSPEVGPPPDPAQGWGRVDIAGSLFPEPLVHLDVRDDAADAVGTGEARDYPIDVADGSRPFRVTLVWSDHPGPGLVNSLRLSVISPAGVVTEAPVAQHGNNVQRVEIDLPDPGTHTVRVTGIDVTTEALHGAKQDFAVVVTGGLDVADLYLRATPDDDGVVPSVRTDRHSPDIWVSLVDDPSAPPVANPERGRTNYVFVRANNRGPLAVADAEVELHWVDAAGDLGSQSWQTGDIEVGGTATNAQQLAVPGRAGGDDGQAVTAAFAWTPPAAGDHVLVASIDHTADPLQWGEVDSLQWENNLALLDVTVVDGEPSPAAEVASYRVTLCNDVRFGVTALAFITCTSVDGRRYVLVFTDSHGTTDHFRSDGTVVAFFPAESLGHYVDLLRNEAPIEIEASADLSRVILTTGRDEPPGEGGRDRDVGLSP